MEFKFKFEIGQEVYKLDKTGNYFYVAVGKVQSYSIYSNKIRYKVDGFKLNGEFEEYELLTKEEIINKLYKWLV